MNAGYGKNYGDKKMPDSPESVEKNKLVVDYGKHPYTSSQPVEYDVDFGKEKKHAALRGFILAIIIMTLIYSGYRFVLHRNRPVSDNPIPVDLTLQENIPQEEIKEPLDLAYLRGRYRYKELYSKYLDNWTPPELDAPDTVCMENGKMFTGRIVSITDTTVIVKTMKETVECPVSEMKYYSKIKFSAKEYADYMALKMFDHELSVKIE